MAALLDTAPIDLARACYMICSEAMLRDCFFETAHKANDAADTGVIHWPWSKGSGWTRGKRLQSECWSKVLDEREQDLLVIPPVHVNESAKFASDESAAKWVNEQYAEITTRHLEEDY